MHDYNAKYVYFTYFHAMRWHVILKWERGYYHNEIMPYKRTCCKIGLSALYIANRKIAAGQKSRGGKQCFDTLLKDWATWSWY